MITRSKGEEVCCFSVNTGLFAAIKQAGIGRGQTGSAIMVSLEILVFLTERPLGTPVIQLLSSHKCQGVLLFPICQNSITFAAAPLVLTPFVRNQKATSGACSTATTTTTTSSRSTKGFAWASAENLAMVAMEDQ